MAHTKKFWLFGLSTLALAVSACKSRAFNEGSRTDSLPSGKGVRKVDAMVCSPAEGKDALTVAVVLDAANRPLAIDAKGRFVNAVGGVSNPSFAFQGLIDNIATPPQQGELAAKTITFKKETPLSLNGKRSDTVSVLSMSFDSKRSVSIALSENGSTNNLKLICLADAREGLELLLVDKLQAPPEEMALQCVGDEWYNVVAVFNDRKQPIALRGNGKFTLQGLRQEFEFYAYVSGTEGSSSERQISFDEGANIEVSGHPLPLQKFSFDTNTGVSSFTVNGSKLPVACDMQPQSGLEPFKKDLDLQSTTTCSQANNNFYACFNMWPKCQFVHKTKTCQVRQVTPTKVQSQPTTKNISEDILSSAANFSSLISGLNCRAGAGSDMTVKANFDKGTSLRSLKSFAKDKNGNPWVKVASGATECFVRASYDYIKPQS